MQFDNEQNDLAHWHVTRLKMPPNALSSTSTTQTVWVVAAALVGQSCLVKLKIGAVIGGKK